jgi:hypothetical protein
MNHDHHPRIPRRVIASSAALLCLAVACGEVSNAARADTAAGGGNGGGGAGGGVAASAGGSKQTGGGAGSGVAASAGGSKQTATAGGGGSSAATPITHGGASATDAAGAGAGAGAGAPDACALSTGDGASSSGDASGPVGAPPNGYLVYLAETTSLGKQVFHVRLHDGVVSAPVRLTPDAGVDGYLVIPQRRATITVTGARDPGFRLTLVDFDESGATGSYLLPSSRADEGDVFSNYGTNSDGSLLFASPGIRFFDLRPSTPEPQDLSGYSVTAAYGWSGSRLLFSGTKASTGEKGWFSADVSASPPAATLLAAPMGGSIGFAISPDKAHAIYPSKSANGDTSWYLSDLTATTPAPVQLTSAALLAPVSLGISAWSPDSRYYVVEVDPGVLVLVDVKDPSRGQVVSAAGATNFTFASFSPDSQRLVYVASHGGSETTQLYGVALGQSGPSAAYPLIRGTEEEQTAYVNQPGLLEWMYGSRYLVYLGQNPHSIYLADASGCSGRRVRFGSEQSEPFTQNGFRAAPNARRAAFFSDFASPGGAIEVYVADIDDEGDWGEATRISGSDGGVGLAQELRFLDGDWLMFYAEDAARRATLYLAPRDGSTPARLLSDPNDAILYTTWVADEP